MRTRFTKAEKAWLTVGAKVEWRNGSHWHPGTINSPVTRTRDGWDEVGLTNHAKTATVSPGQYITGMPTCVRLPLS